MPSLVAGALTYDSQPPLHRDGEPRGKSGRRELGHGVDRVLYRTFWRPSSGASLATVVPILERLHR